MNDFGYRLHEAAQLIPDGPPLEQSIFKLVTCELRGHDVPGAEAVKRAIAVTREASVAFTPLYDPRLLDL